MASVTGADTTHANTSAGGNRTLTGSLGTANVQLVQETGVATVTQSASIAASEAEFHKQEIQQDVARWNDVAGYTPIAQQPYEMEYQRAKVTSEFGWRSGAVPAFTDFVTDSVQADVDLTHDVADAGRIQANTGADADVTFVSASAPLSATLQTSTAATLNSYTVGTVTRDNARLTELAGTLGDLTNVEANAEKLHANAVAAAERARRTAQAQAAQSYANAQAAADTVQADAVLQAEIAYYPFGSYTVYQAAITLASDNHAAALQAAASIRSSAEQAAELTYKQAVGNADLALATAKSASRQGWINATVDAEQQLVIDESNAIKLRRDAIAGQQRTCVISLAPVVGDRDVDRAAALTGFWDAEQAGDNTWLTSVSEAQGDFWDADYMHSIHLGLGLSLSWGSAMNGLGGAAKDAWQFSLRDNYIGLADDINSANTAYQDTLTSQYLSMANSLRTEDITLATALAGAERTQAITFSTLESQLFIDMAELSNTYLQDDEAAAHTNRMANATAQRHFFVGLDGGGNAFGQTELGEALAAASTTLSNARQAIERTYDRGDVTTFGAFNIALAENTHDYFATSTSATLTHSTAEAALERAYSVQEATANHLRETTVAGLDENYRRLESMALANAVTGFSGSPWLDLNIALVNADDDFRTAESNAAEALRTAVADADEPLEIAAAYAMEELTNTLAEIGADEVMAAANGEVGHTRGTGVFDDKDARPPLSRFL